MICMARKNRFLLLLLLMVLLLPGCGHANTEKIRFDRDETLRMTIGNRALICAGISDELLKQPVSLEVNDHVWNVVDEVFGGKKVALSDAPYAGEHMIKISTPEMTLWISDGSQVVVSKDGLYGSFAMSEKETETLYDLIRKEYRPNS